MCDQLLATLVFLSHGNEHTLCLHEYVYDLISKFKIDICSQHLMTLSNNHALFVDNYIGIMLDDTTTTPLSVNPVLVIILDDHNYLINANDDEKLKCHIGITASIFLGK